MAGTDAELSLIVVNEEADLFALGNVMHDKRYPVYATYRTVAGLLDRFRANTAYK